jgi:hypothetical protein
LRRALAALLEAVSAEPEVARMATVAGTEAVISHEVAAGRAEQLPELLPDLPFTVLTPYVGPDAASAEVRRTEGALAVPAD